MLELLPGTVPGVTVPEADLHRFLKCISIFKYLNEDDIRSFASAVKTEAYEPDRTVIEEGAAGDILYMIYSGEVEVSQLLTLKTSRTGFESKDKALSRVSTGEFGFFGEIALLSEGIRTATVKTVTRCVFLTLSREDFNRYAKKNPVLGYNIMLRLCEILCVRLIKSNKDVLKLTTALSIALRK